MSKFAALLHGHVRLDVIDHDLTKDGKEVLTRALADVIASLEDHAAPHPSLIAASFNQNPIMRTGWFVLRSHDDDVQHVQYRALV